jgi:O-antigen ligase
MWQHPNSLGGLAVCTVPFVYYLYPVVKKRWAKMAVLGLLVSSLACVLYSASRTAYLGLIVFLAFVLSKSRRKFSAILILGIVVGTAIPYLPEQYKGRFSSIFTGHEAEGNSSETRKQILRDAWVIFKEHPLGIGIGTFPLIREDRFGRVQDTHNMYMEALVNLGVQGFVIFMILMWKVYRVFGANDRAYLAQIARMAALPFDKKTPPEVAAERAAHLADLRYARGANMAAMGYLVVHAFTGFFGTDLYEIEWWICIGLAAANFRLHQLMDRRTQTLAPAAVEEEDKPRAAAALA